MAGIQDRADFKDMAVLCTRLAKAADRAAAAEMRSAAAGGHRFVIDGPPGTGNRERAAAARYREEAVDARKRAEFYRTHTSYPSRLRPNRRRTSQRRLSRNYAALVRAGAQAAVRLARAPAVRKAATAAVPYAIEVVKTGATALQTKLQGKLRRWGEREPTPPAAPARVTANRRRTSIRRNSRRLQANAYFARFKILDASIDRQDHAGRDVYRVDVEITAPRRERMAFGGRWGPTRTVSGDTMVIRVYPDGRFNMLDSRGMTQHLASDLTEAQRKKVLAAVKKLGGKVPDTYGPRR